MDDDKLADGAGLPGGGRGPVRFDAPDCILATSQRAVW